MANNFLDDTLDGDYTNPTPLPSSVPDRLYRYLDDDRVIGFHTKYLLPVIGDVVSIQEQLIPDGYYRLRDEATRFLILNSKVDHEYYVDFYTNRKGITIEVDGSRITGIMPGSMAWYQGAEAPDGWYRRAWLTQVLIRNGRVMRKVF